MAGRVTINEAALREITRGERGPVVQHINGIVRRATNEAKRRVGVDEGRLRSSIDGTVTVRGDQVIGRIGSNVSYALVHHEGHGEIRPVRARVLRFKPKGAQGFVFAMRVGPVAGNPFLVNGLRAASPYPVIYTPLR